MNGNTRRFGNGAARKVASTGAALAFGLLLTIGLFLLLPVLRDIGRAEKKEDLVLTSVDTAEPPPPAPDVKDPEPPKQEDEPPPPELSEVPQALDLSQLELALNPGMGDGSGGDFAMKGLSGASTVKAAQSSDEIFALTDLDQSPRVSYQPPPQYPADMKKKKQEGTVHILFIVDTEGRVQNPKVQKSTNPAFDAAAMSAVRKWRFEPGRKGGKPVQFRMRVPITFAL